ncbi:MAG: metallophosphatase [Candidatus Eisenbacteria sp.]|nr:metallophosphatase [Candidatus Eisenbacteria bacterium]
MTTRRGFLRHAGAGLASIGLGSLAGGLEGWFQDALARPGDSDELVITVLHTNDVHSRIDPFPADGGRNAGLAGAARRASLIDRIRAENPRTLLLDAGDVFQGTPYFNLFKGEVDFKVMSALGYDAMTVGNHDFDAGIDGLQAALKYADFELVSANYDFSQTPLADRIKPFITRTFDDVRIGIFGLGVGLEGLVAPALRRGVIYREPYPVAAEMVRRLREQEACDLVICLSHMGNQGYHGEPGEQELAREVTGIDLIIGGHSHTFMEEPSRVHHGDRETLVFQVGWGGINLGRVDFHVRRGAVIRSQAAALRVGRAARRHAVDALKMS